MANKDNYPVSILNVSNVIIKIRNQRVILDRDLAKLYGTQTKRLNEQVKRNINRFPSDFMFQLSESEKIEVVANCDHLKILKHSSMLPYAFTEHGAIMAASVLNTQIAVDTSILVVRAFIQAREIIFEHADLKRRLDDIERKLAKKFSDNEAELMEIRFAIQQLMMPLDQQNKRPLGFGRNRNK